ncbi:hypothetical protein M0R45_020118 [Rubus argutus]|uniref:Reverse transcriptase domain-containing protein n=1 Tax=Rubus argutus TaxID=59490 RepID=A0AAW1XAS4_RUBAR
MSMLECVVPKLHWKKYRLKFSFGPSVERFSREDLAHSKFLFDLFLQATLLRDKCRLRWLMDGDRNTAFLHNMVKVRRLNKSIATLIVNQTVLLIRHPSPRMWFNILRILSCFIMPYFNSNTLILVPKLQDSVSVTDYCPIALANFVLKIITKIVADRLGPIALRIISPNQSAFIPGSSIVDPIILTLECVNLLDTKCKRENVAIKFDIRKAFDTIDWNFLLRVLRSFGFTDPFIDLIHNILKSAYLSVNVNGQACRYFTCSRGVRQGDPLSPLLFCFAEEVLSHGITQLVDKIKCIAAPQCVSFPCLFADVMMFVQGNVTHLVP